MQLKKKVRVVKKHNVHSKNKRLKFKEFVKKVVKKLRVVKHHGRS